MISYDTMNFAIDQGVAEITLTRPDEANTLTAQMVRDLKDVVEKCSQDQSVRAVLLMAQPGPFFCAGGDLGQFANAGAQLPKFAEEMLLDFHPTMERFFSMDAPLVVAVNGAVAGIGCSFVLGANHAVFGESANFTMAYTGAGLTPDGGGTYFLPRIVGLRAAEELIMTNRTLGAQGAFEWGIANQVVADDKLHEMARNVARQYANGPTRAFGNVRQLLLSSMNNSLTDQLAAEAKSFAQMCGTKDCHEGIHAFLEKRQPKFSGR